jgi:hypothetical protein
MQLRSEFEITPRLVQTQGVPTRKRGIGTEGSPSLTRRVTFEKLFRTLSYVIVPKR